MMYTANEILLKQRYAAEHIFAQMERCMREVPALILGRFWEHFCPDERVNSDADPPPR